MMHVAITLQPADLRHAHRTVFANTTEIVAQQVYYHYVFRAILGRLQQFLGAAAVLLRRRAARAGALNRPGFDLAVLDAEEALRPGAGDDEIVGIEIAGKRRRVALPQTPV